jgi:tRNA nucleotidyltransferase (CCA-adding enzyme)
LQRAGLLEIAFPELAALIGKTQPEAFHPEGDAFEHTLLIVDKVAGDTTSLTARFAGLAHDLGKGTTTAEMLPHHYGHEVRGLEVLAAWKRRMTLPKEWMKAGAFVIREHMRAPRLGKTGKIATLLLNLAKSGLTIAEFKAIIRADHGGLPLYLEKAGQLISAMSEVSGKEAPKGLSGPEIGTWLFSQQVRILQRKLREAKG